MKVVTIKNFKLPRSAEDLDSFVHGLPASHQNQFLCMASLPRISQHILSAQRFRLRQFPPRSSRRSPESLSLKGVTRENFNSFFVLRSIHPVYICSERMRARTHAHIDTGDLDRGGPRFPWLYDL